jgi:hypothetical protein
MTSSQGEQSDKHDCVKDFTNSHLTRDMLLLLLEMATESVERTSIGYIIISFD